MSIVSVLGESAVRSLALALAVAVVLRLLRIQHARIVKRAWTAVLVFALAMPALVALHIPSFSFTPPWATPQTILLTAPHSSAVSPDAVLPPATRRHPQSSRDCRPTLAPAVTFSVPVPRDFRVPRHPSNTFTRGKSASLPTSPLRPCCCFACCSAFRSLRASGVVRSPSPHPKPLSPSASRTSLLDLRSPATVGHGILLPLEAISWDDATLRTTLAHETEHIREGDFYLQLAATLHHCFFWISPHAWWLRPQLSRLSETICDRAAITSGRDGLSYAQLLLRFAAAEQAPAGMVAMAQSAGLLERIDRLIADPELAGAFRRAPWSGCDRRRALLCRCSHRRSLRPHRPAETVVLASPQAPAASAMLAVSSCTGGRSRRFASSAQIGSARCRSRTSP